MLVDENGVIHQERASALGELVKIVILQQYDKLNDFKHLYCKYGGKTLPKEQMEIECPSWVSRWIVSQTFTAMSLEAFYFDYIQNNASKTQADKRRTPPQRFQYICQDILKIDSDNVDKLLSKLVLLDKTRTHWAHNKSADFDNYKKVQEFFSPDECIRILFEVFDLISSHDSSCIVARETSLILKQVQNNVANEVAALAP
ncbi:hypothetical protein [Shewanella sp. MBTL60-112-B1]|uniref:hypothetical protein n=1 Tax=Shewanella sp. MBTL60-112-B1 TaxID=2815916 RepID=UPI001BC2B274|nr:hypothetical protein [Shewanella sp. MBTL60-112-B1]GIU09195.1 hypothetical protein TUM4444_11490 [Shewanella sp. MBTL60-112-B1]